MLHPQRRTIPGKEAHQVMQEKWKLEKPAD